MYDTKSSGVIRSRSKGIIDHQVESIEKEENVEKRENMFHKLKADILTLIDEKETLKSELLDLYRSLKGQ